MRFIKHEEDMKRVIGLSERSEDVCVYVYVCVEEREER